MDAIEAVTDEHRFQAPPTSYGISIPAITVLEGIDGAGKTTVANLVCEKLLERGMSVLYAHAVAVDPEQYLDLWINAAFASQRALVAGTAVVWDRSWIGELVYGPELRGTVLANSDAQILNRVWRQAKPVLIDCPPATAKQRLIERGDDAELIEHLPGLTAAYRRLNLPAATTIDEAVWMALSSAQPADYLAPNLDFYINRVRTEL